MWIGLPAPARADSGSAALSLADVLDSDGRAHWPKDFAGSVNAGDFDVFIAPDGEPRFASRTAVVADSPYEWVGFGSVRHGCNGAINALLRMPNGDLILGGNFTVCGAIEAIGVVRWDGKRWSSLMGPTFLSGSVQIGHAFALALRGTDLIVGGWLRPIAAPSRISPPYPINGFSDATSVIAAHYGTAIPERQTP